MSISLSSASSIFRPPRHRLPTVSLLVLTLDIRAFDIGHKGQCAGRVVDKRLIRVTLCTSALRQHPVELDARAHQKLVSVAIWSVLVNAEEAKGRRALHWPRRDEA